MAAALNKEHLIVCGDSEELTKILLCVIQNILKHLGAVAHLHHGHACPLVIEHLFRRFPQHFLRKYRWTGTKIKYACHPFSSLSANPQNETNA